MYIHKRKSKTTYITATAICHLANQYVQTFLALPFAVGDLGLTNVYQTFRKGFVTILLRGVGPLMVIRGPVTFTFVSILVISGLRLAFNNLNLIPTSPIDLTKDLKPRIPGISDVIVVTSRDKITMSEPVQKNQKCWLAGQPLFNSNCQVKITEMPDAIDSVLSKLNYQDAVNMKDVTGLDRV